MRVGQSLNLRTSLTLVGTPSRGPSGAPFTQRSSDLGCGRPEGLVVTMAEGIEIAIHLVEAGQHGIGDVDG